VQPERLVRLAVRPEVCLRDLLAHTGLADTLVTPAPGLEAVETLLEIELKYEGYVEREREMVARMAQLEQWAIPSRFNYQEVAHITLEAREKLGKIQPENLGQASRISGVSPADISVLMVLLRRGPAVRPQDVEA
jgi:tRNA uridine 5-carboxymethylaminomethyl modification enzyme